MWNKEQKTVSIVLWKQIGEDFHLFFSMNSSVKHYCQSCIKFWIDFLWLCGKIKQNRVNPFKQISFFVYLRFKIAVTIARLIVGDMAVTSFM